MRYGPTALTVGATVKLVRSLWIVPMAIATAAMVRSRAKIAWPWVILFFAAATCVNTLFPQGQPVWNVLARSGKSGFTATLFLIGSGLDRSALATVGWRPLAMGVLLWIMVATASLIGIRAPAGSRFNRYKEAIPWLQEHLTGPNVQPWRASPAD